MIYVDQDILDSLRAKDIEILPFDKARLGSNSYDLTLGPTLLQYDSSFTLDCKHPPDKYRTITMKDEGYVIQPGSLYLGCTNEYTSSRLAVPCIEGKSSIARLGISVHATAGFGDVGFAGTWTLEISCIVPVRIYPDIPIAQIYFYMTMGRCQKPYHLKEDAKYSNQPGRPVPSAMWKNFI